jgi:hypothetical protein
LPGRIRTAPDGFDQAFIRRTFKYRKTSAFTRFSGVSVIQALPYRKFRFFRSLTVRNIRGNCPRLAVRSVGNRCIFNAAFFFGNGNAWQRFGTFRYYRWMDGNSTASNSAVVRAGLRRAGFPFSDKVCIKPREISSASLSLRLIFSAASLIDFSVSRFLLFSIRLSA